MYTAIKSKLDYANALLGGICENHLNKLQLLQNRAVRLVCRLKPWDHVTPSFKDLHWLKVKERICFKILVHVYKCVKLQNHCPLYLSELVNHRCFNVYTRLSDRNLLEDKSIITNVGKRCFSYNASSLWNALDDDFKDCDSILSFKRSLKTHYFNLLYC